MDAVQNIETAAGTLLWVQSHPDSACSGRECYAGIQEFSNNVNQEAKRHGIARKLQVTLIDATQKTNCR